MRGPSISVSPTKIILDFGTINSLIVRLSKLIIAAIRSRSRLLKMILGVR